MIGVLERQRSAAAILGPVLAVAGAPSHAYLFHGPGGSGKREVARELAARLLAQGAPDPASAQARALAGVHPDLTWVIPSGAHEVLVSDIDEPVVAAAARTPFESSRRLFVIDGAEQLGDQAAARLLKTLEEPPPFVHMILIAERFLDVLETIRSRCQPVRFEAPSTDELAAQLCASGLEQERARACALLSLGDGARARELAAAEGAELRERALELVRGALAGAVQGEPWAALLAAVRARGERTRGELEAQAAAALELLPSRERKRAESEWSDRVRRGRRRAETAQLALALDLVEAWLLDLVALASRAGELVRHADRGAQLREDAAGARGADLSALARGVALVEETRQRLWLNVNEELALEALAYRLAEVLSR